jgi:uncharacterized membrane protein YebE (DUF533 family)
MLEIFILWQLTKTIGKIIEGKGQKSGGYKVLTVILWFGGEIAGAILGTMITGTSADAQCLIYIFALGGAAVGAGIAYLIAQNVSPSQAPQQAALADNPVQQLNALKKGFEEGLITEGEYETRKADLLSKM